MINVIIVDDEPMIHEILLRDIKWQQYNMHVVATFESAIKALSYFEKNNGIDLIITDMVMPQMHGNEFIEKLSRFQPNLKYIVLSSYSDYQTVRRSFRNGVIDYVLKEDIHTSLTHFLRQFQKDFMAGSPHLFKEHIKTLLGERVLNKQYFCVFYINLQKLVQDLNKYFPENSDIPEKVHWFLVKCKEDWYTIVCWDHDPNERELKTVLTEITTEIQKRAEHFHIGISHVSSLDRIDNLYEEAKFATDRKFYEPESREFRFISKPTNVDFKLPWDEIKKEIRNAIQHIDFLKTQNIVLRSFDWIFQNEINETTAKQLVLELYLYIHHHFFDYGLIPPYFKQEDIQKRIHSFVSYYDLKKWGTEYIHAIENHYWNEVDKDLVRLVKLYIERNFNHDLRRVNLAKKFAVSEGYLSRCFTTETGIKLVQYINHVRMQQAKTYIANSDMSISEISEKVGFANIEHFSRVFKKNMGISPQKYRNI
jgi:two-component system response regulator YesN